MTRIRQSVPTEGMAEKYLTGQWRYVMPDFARPGCSIIESTFDDQFTRVPETKTERTHERSTAGT